MRPEILYTIFEKEGGEKVTDNPNDPGGVTKYGISQRSYPRLHREKGIENITLGEAYAIAERDFWNKLRCDEIVSMRVRWKLFDTGFNMSTITAIMILQKALGMEPDGILGPFTLNQVNSIKLQEDEFELLHKMCYHQSVRYINIVSHDISKIEFLIGWFNRAMDYGANIPTYHREI